MKWVISLLVFALAAVVTHVVTLHAVPGVIMDRAMTTMAESGVPLHSFTLAPAATPQNQSVVRPSPDLAYSICRYDLGEAGGDIVLQAGASEGYGSIAVFDDQTNNIASIRVPEGEVLRTSLGNSSAAEIKAASETGLILIRRLAPTPEARARVEAASAEDLCGPV